MSNYKEKILVVEDDIQIQNFICYLLDAEGFTCIKTNTGKDAINILINNTIDIMLLDLGLPDIDGMEIISKVREWSEIPIIVVSARDQDKEKANALDLGADDYLTKPFSATELLARIRVSLRHLYKENISKKVNTNQIDKLKIDYDKHLVYLEEKELHVTPLEYTLLTVLFNNMGKVLTTKYIIKEVYGIGYGTDTQALRALMAGLRRKIETNPAKPRYIMTEIGVGYRLVDE